MPDAAGTCLSYFWSLTAAPRAANTVRQRRRTEAMQAALLRDRDGEAGTAGPGDRALRGVFIIAQTPFRQDLELDEDSLRREMDFLVCCGVHGVVWPVAASEVMSLSFRERLAGAEWIAQELRGRLPFVVGVTANNRFEAAEYAAQARELGAAALLALPQTDYQPTDPAMFAEYLAAIAGRGQLPIIVQTSYPGHGSSLSPHLLMHLAREVPLLRYVKEEQVGFGPLPWRISAYASAEADHRLGAFAGAGARNLLNEFARGSAGTMPGAGFADI